MAQNGGGMRPQRFNADGTLPRLAVVGAATASSSEMVPDRDLITLAQPRPGIARVRNEYIETPLRTQQLHLVSLVQAKGKSDESRPGRISPSVAALLPVPRGRTRVGQPPNTHLGLLPVVTQQPAVANFKKSDSTKSQQRQSLVVVSDGGAAAPTSDAAADDEHQEQHRESIICAECRRCKCDACRTPRPLPAAWICGGKYQCSAETVVDHCSCMCCVKAIFYHYTKDSDDGVDCADRPCSCVPHQRCQRWGCVGLLATVLPCLLFYWPLRGCLKLCEGCYARYHNRGCQCVRHKATTTQPVRSAKRLLDGVVD